MMEDVLIGNYELYDRLIIYKIDNKVVYHLHNRWHVNSPKLLMTIMYNLYLRNQIRSPCNILQRIVQIRKTSFFQYSEIPTKN